MACVHLRRASTPWDGWLRTLAFSRGRVTYWSLAVQTPDCRTASRRSSWPATLSSWLALADREEDRPPLAMPATSIYSRADGIVPWQACLDLPGPLRENIEVTASHLGMGMNPGALEIILDRLAQPVGAWQPYRVAPVTA
jgi:hypothetical protein